MARARRDPRTGRFKKATRRKSTRRRRRNPGRTTTAKRAAPRRRARTTTARRRTTVRRRRNPPRFRPVDTLMSGAKSAVQITIGKAAARAIPTMVPQLPKQGMPGLATQAAVSLALGYAAQEVLGNRDLARDLVAGGLSGIAETLAVAYDVPLLGAALAPTTASAALSGYVAGPRGAVSLPANTGLQTTLGAYAQPSRRRRRRGGLRSYV